MHFISEALDFGPRFDLAAATSIGAGALKRSENQDNFLLIDASGQAALLANQLPERLHVPDWPAGHVRAAVLDGMGGHGNGREAAEAVVQGLLAMPACTSHAMLAAKLDQLHARLQLQFNQAPAARQPGTTLTLLEMPPDGDPLLYHVGDSRLYEVSKNTVTCLTVDHVPATVHAMAGLLDESGWRARVHGQHHPQIAQAFILGNVINDRLELQLALVALDAGNLPSFLAHLGDRRLLPLRPDAYYVLASDGFWSCARPDEAIARWPALCRGKTAAQASEAILGDFMHQPPAGLHSDNLTALVLRLRA